MGIELARCSWCDELYRVDITSRDGFCTPCSNEHNFKINKQTAKEIEIRKWSDKKVKKQWNDAARMSRLRLIGSCEGTNYKGYNG